MNNLVGKYRGTPVYRTSLPEYVNGRYYKSDDSVIYLIDQDMIRENVIFAKYDGKVVEEYDRHERAVYYTVPKITPVPAAKEAETANCEPKTSSSVGKSVEETIAGVYETDYFANMTDINAFLKSNS